LNDSFVQEDAQDHSVQDTDILPENFNMPYDDNKVSEQFNRVGNEHLNDDDRKKWDWKSRWDTDAIAHIRTDAVFVGIVFLLTLIAIVLTWRGTMFEWISIGCASCTRTRFDQFAYFFLGGMLGGTLFGIKYLYKVVARGRWHLDRRLW
jgi:hypothetical protein